MLHGNCVVFPTDGVVGPNYAMNMNKQFVLSFLDFMLVARREDGVTPIRNFPGRLREWWVNDLGEALGQLLTISIVGLLSVLEIAAVAYPLWHALT